MSQKYEIETALLPHIAKAVSVSVPTIMYTGRGPVNAFTFVGYPFIKGTQLSELRDSLSAAVLDRMSRELANFLRSIHGLPLDDAIRAGLADVTGEALRPFVQGAVEPGSRALTDAWGGYSGLSGLGLFVVTPLAMA